jgi:hypothetical protein
MDFLRVGKSREFAKMEKPHVGFVGRLSDEGGRG